MARPRLYLPIFRHESKVANCKSDNYARSQVEKSEPRQYLQLVQYCASCNRGVMPVLPVNTVPNIGIVLAYYWRRTGAVFFGSTGETLK